MSNKPDPWSIIKEFARSNGISPFALRKWRQRGVPWRWRFDLRELYPTVFAGAANFGPFKPGKRGRPRKAPETKRGRK
ncbi:MAG: hypothetical protein ACK5XN_18845 [Bacteroidota bacterium]|jgi:hypothetical protein